MAKVLISLKNCKYYYAESIKAGGQQMWAEDI
jgi:hypothetical protein